jgi:hypothetical protein
MENAIEVASEHRWPERLAGWNHDGWKQRLFGGRPDGE